MANIPLIPATQQTYARFKRRYSRKLFEVVDADEKEQQKPNKRFRRRLGDRRRNNVSVMLDRRQKNDRRMNANSTPSSTIKDTDAKPDKGSNINTTA